MTIHAGGRLKKIVVDRIAARRQRAIAQGWVESPDQNERTQDSNENVAAALGRPHNHEWMLLDGVWFIRRID